MVNLLLMFNLVLMVQTIQVKYSAYSVMSNKKHDTGEQVEGRFLFWFNDLTVRNIFHCVVVILGRADTLCCCVTNLPQDKSNNWSPCADKERPAGCDLVSRVWLVTGASM